MKTTNAQKTNLDRSQRGAALVTVLMISTLMLATGGTLILVTAMSTRTTIDATAERQAFYGAEAGIQDTLNVLRGNVNPQPGMPTGSRITFRSAVTPSTSNRPGDASTTARLSGWLNYNYPTGGDPDRVGMTPFYSPINGLAYAVEITDPDSTPVALEPTRLLIRVRGFGPKSAEKRLELIIKRTSFDYSARSMLMIRSADDCSPVIFTAGDSAAKDYTGHDNAPTGVVLPSYGATCDLDVTLETAADTKNTVQEPKAAKIPISNLPPYLQTTDGEGGARNFLYGEDGLMGSAIAQGRYFTSFDGVATGFTFVDGNCNLDGGSGLLIVTGRLIMNGNPDFDGLILVMGEGYVNREGAGNGVFHGAMAVARFNKTSGPFLAPTFLTDGSGTGDMIFDSDKVRQAVNVSGPRALGVHEY